MTAFLIFAGAYLVYVPFLPGAYMTPKLLVIAAGALWGLRAHSVEPPLRKAFALVTGAAFLSSLLADSPLAAIAGRTNVFSQGFPGVVLAWVCYEAGAATGERYHHALDLTVALAALAAGLQASGFFLVTPLPAGRIYGLAGSPPFLGCMMALAAPLIIQRRPTLGLLLGATVWLTGSRAGAIGYVAGMAVLFLPMGGQAITLGGGLIGAALGPQRMYGDGMRVDTWMTACKAIWARPIAGWGVDGFQDAFMLLRTPERWGAINGGMHGMESTHNFLLDVLVSTGVVGLAAVIYLGHQAWKQNYPRPVIAATAAVLAYGCFNPTPFTAFAALAFVWGNCDA